MGSAAARHAAGGSGIELRLVELGHPECHRDLERSSVVQRHRDLLRREGRRLAAAGRSGHAPPSCHLGLWLGLRVNIRSALSFCFTILTS